MDTCTTCAKPLGSDSKDFNLDLITEYQKAYCPTCRLCASCNKPLAAPELKFCIENNYPLQHARCMSLSHDKLPLTQEVTFLNLARLLILPNREISEVGNEYEAEQAVDKLILFHNMDLESQFLSMRKMMAAAARISLVLKKDKDAIKTEMAKRATKQLEVAKQEAKTSSRPPGKPADASYETTLANFMQREGITDRKLGIKKLTLREKAIDSYCKFGISVEDAAKIVDQKMESDRRVQ